MNLRPLACAAMIGCALAVIPASAQREARERTVQQNSSVTLHAFVESWQQRIIAENLFVADPQTWAARSLPKLASFSAERLGLAMQAGSIGELEALMVSAPIANGTTLGLLAATSPGNIALDAMTKRAVQKSDPSTSPASYADLAFTALNSCRIYDSRLAAGGIWVNGASRQIRVGPYPAAGGGYSTGTGAQGGSATGCGLDTLAGPGEVAAVMVAASTFTQSGAGYLTFFSDSTADPSATVVSMFYQPGSVQTSFVVFPTDLIADTFSRGISRNANTHVTLDIVGYFAKPHAAALDCTTVSGPGAVVPAAGGLAGTGSDTAPACAAGYSRTGLTCSTTNILMDLAGLSGATCSWNNNDASPGTGTAVATCCRAPGR